MLEKIISEAESKKLKQGDLLDLIKHSYQLEALMGENKITFFFDKTFEFEEEKSGKILRGAYIIDGCFIVMQVRVKTKPQNYFSSTIGWFISDHLINSERVYIGNFQKC